ncbi:glycoside hydrolase family 26 protein [Streptomyces sp. MI02-7b]|uniref:glycoside hydrolase family 26 protein n=1 Tax=Streptomyces sp. MI02-7b TaxID=462941 RepID=UPI0029B985A3|nr:glycosyl hydrolase [Streptomyces sp. MI02-7b]MDX3074937.1 glycosyl hydrolase [Streptomyces sp. MI02-7b]
MNLFPVSLRRAAAGALLVCLTGTGCVSGATHSGSNRGAAPESSAVSEVPEVTYDTTDLLKPDKKYFGVAVDGAPDSLTPVGKYADLVGKQPNVVASYSAWGNDFNIDGARRVLGAGAMLYVSWEPFKPSLAKIADGSQDEYIRRYASEVRKGNAPVAISFGHEMNGHWYPWGTKNATPAQFVKAWRHIHDIFQDEGATNVIWVWSPNVVNPVPDVALKPYWPGDAYVDWVGVVGYWTATGASTFDTLYGPTTSQVRKFTKKPFFLSETASEPGQRRRADVRSLFEGIEAHDDVLGFVWFNITKRADWRLQASPLALAEFKRLAADDRIGFEVPRQ